MFRGLYINDVIIVYWLEGLSVNVPFILNFPLHHILVKFEILLFNFETHAKKHWIVRPKMRRTSLCQIYDYYLG